MAVETRPDWVTRDEFRALTAAQAQVGESDKRLATKADVTAVQVELAWVKKLLWVLLSLCLTIFAGVIVLLFRMFAVGFP